MHGACPDRRSYQASLHSELQSIHRTGADPCFRLETPPSHIALGRTVLTRSAPFGSVQVGNPFPARGVASRAGPRPAGCCRNRLLQQADEVPDTTYEVVGGRA